MELPRGCERDRRLGSHIYLGHKGEQIWKPASHVVEREEQHAQSEDTHAPRQVRLRKQKQESGNLQTVCVLCAEREAEEQLCLTWCTPCSRNERSVPEHSDDLCRERRWGCGTRLAYNRVPDNSGYQLGWQAWHPGRRVVHGGGNEQRGIEIT
jgi:hypothetical protein